MFLEERLEVLKLLESLLRARLQDHSSEVEELWRQAEKLLTDAKNLSASGGPQSQITIRSLVTSLLGRGVLGLGPLITDQNFPIVGRLDVSRASVQSLGRGKIPLVSREEAVGILHAKGLRPATGGEILLFLDRLTSGQVLARPLFALGQSYREGNEAHGSEKVICARQFMGRIEVTLFPVQSGWHRAIYDFLALPI